MKGRLFQIENVDEEVIGIWHTDDYISTEQIDQWFREFDNSDQYDENGLDGFDDYVLKTHGHSITRVFTEVIHL